MMKNFFLFLIFFFFKCMSINKRWFYIKKKEVADEFLVEKKIHLVLPPDFGKLPLPKMIILKKKK